jgi:siroheme synthase-like protein
MSGAALFPIFLKLDGRKCLVVGGTHECEQKVQGLLSSGAVVEVVAEQVTGGIEELHRREALTWRSRAFRETDLEGVALVVAQDPSQAVNGEVFRIASERGVLCNVVDQPALCDFYYPAVVRRGDLQIAISTNGLSPALASSIRAELEQRFGPSYEAWVKRLGRVRQRILRRVPKTPERTVLLQRFATRSRFEQFERRRARNVRGEG